MSILDTETLKAVGLVIGSLITGAVAKAKLPVSRNKKAGQDTGCGDSDCREQVVTNTEKIATLEKGQSKLFGKINTVAVDVSYIKGQIDAALQKEH